MRFEFATANRIIFGPGVVKEVGALVKEHSQRVLIVSGWTANRQSVLADVLLAQGIDIAILPVSGEPTTDLVRDGAKLARQADSQVIIGFGGGSAIDTAKAIAALMTNAGDPLDYLEVIGKGKPLLNPSAPCIAIPTTAGTGAEVTRNAVLLSPEHRVKVSLRSAHMLPGMAVIDPVLTHSLPPAVTASTGMDALAQLIEPFVSIKANPITDTFCREGMCRAARALRTAFEQGDNPLAREEMALASLLGGLALANAGLGAVHGFAGVIGGMFPAPHGAICARLLPLVMSANVAALRKRKPDHAVLRRYSEVAQILTANPTAVAQDGVIWVEELCEALKIPGLSAYGIGEGDVPELVTKSTVASSMQANPIKLETDEMCEILAQAL